MANAVSQDIADLLAANGFGTKGTDIFFGEWGKDSTDIQTLIIDTSGPDTVDKDQYEQPAFQVLQRGGRQKSVTAVFSKARAIDVFLKEQPPLLTINSTDYLGFDPVSTPTGIGRDENDRYVYTMNYVTFRNPD